MVCICITCAYTAECKYFQKYQDIIEGCCDFGAFTTEAELIEDEALDKEIERRIGLT